MDYKDIKLIVIKTDSTWIERIPYNHFDDELRIGENFMYNKRTIYKFDDEVLEWEFRTTKDYYNHKKDFLAICELVEKIKENRSWKTCSQYYSIKVYYKSGRVVEKCYCDNFSEVGMTELRDAILKALPSGCKVYPRFIC